MNGSVIISAITSSLTKESKITVFLLKTSFRKPLSVMITFICIFN